MNAVYLTQNDGLIIGNVAKLLGLIMNGIFNLIDLIGIPNVGLAIILFTIVVNLLMLPLTLKQQKFSKLSARMQPEIQAIQNKYKNKKDNDSVIAQNQEIQAVYAKYGVSQSGSCIQLLIQMPILFALYRVIYSIPAYVSKIKDTFSVLAEKIISTENGIETFKAMSDGSIATTISTYGKNIVEGNEVNGIIDVLNKLSSSDMAIVAEKFDLSNLTYEGQLILSNDTTTGLLDTYNYFFGLNIANSPQHIISTAISAGTWGLVIGAIMIPLLSALTQWINVKLMPQQNSDNANKSEQENAMASSLKTMNMIMPIMSAWFCFTLPCGMGIYWIAGAVVRGIQQIAINKHFDKMDFEDIIKKNEVKSAKKIEKMKKQQEMINAYASMNTKNIQNKANISTDNVSKTSSKKEDNQVKVDYSSKYKPGSMMAKANMVKEFNEKNNKE